jgi:RNA-binding protein
LDKKRIIELRGKAQALPSTVHIGKEGITQTIIAEITKQLKKTKLVKIKLLPALEMDRRETGLELAKATSSTLIEVRGRTVVLATEGSVALSGGDL